MTKRNWYNFFVREFLIFDRCAVGVLDLEQIKVCCHEAGLVACALVYNLLIKMFIYHHDVAACCRILVIA